MGISREPLPRMESQSAYAVAENQSEGRLPKVLPRNVHYE